MKDFGDLPTSFFFDFKSMLSKHEEQSKCPLLLQKDFVDLSMSFLQIRHLNIGVIIFEVNNNQTLIEI